MWIAAGEFVVWVLLGLMIGLAAHWWKSHADPWPDVLDKDSPLFNMMLTEYSAVNYALDHEYDEAGFWKWESLKNLAFYLVLGLAGVLLPVYATAEGHALARDGLCQAAHAILLKPLFCPAA